MAEIAYKIINATHPAYLGEYLHELDALERGGRAVFDDDRVLSNVLRRGMRESDEQWRERKKRVVYHNYAGEIVGKKLASVFADPLTVAIDQDGEQVEPDEWWEEWFENVAMPGGEPWSIAEHMRCIARRMLVAGVAYTLVDLPRRDTGVEIVTMAQEDALGYRRPYLLEIDPCCVIDWEDNYAGDLSLAIVKTVASKRTGIKAGRDTVTETFRVLTAADWQVWVITYERKNRPDGPQPNDPVTLADAGTHAFGRVPLMRHRPQDGLWLMNGIRSPIGDNLRCVSGNAWLRDKINTPAPYLKIQNVKPDVQENDLVMSEGRGIKGAPGRLTILGEGDELGFASPPTDPLQFNEANAKTTRDELYRVADAMDQSIDNSGAALQRSGESKKMDSAGGSLVNKALGATVRKETLSILRMAELARGEEPHEWSITGCDEIEVDTAGEAADQISLLMTAGPPPLVVELEWERFARLRGYTEAQVQAVRKQASEGAAMDQEAAEKEHDDAINAPPAHEQAMELAKAKGKGKPAFGGK